MKKGRNRLGTSKKCKLRPETLKLIEKLQKKLKGTKGDAKSPEYDHYPGEKNPHKARTKERHIIRPIVLGSA